MEECPKCGSPLVSRDQGGCLVIHCDHCAWETLTTLPNTPFSDQTAYSVRISRVLEPSARTSASLAVALGIPARSARELLRRGSSIATDIPAIEVQRLHRLLSPLGFSLQIEPRFRWDLD